MVCRNLYFIHINVLSSIYSHVIVENTDNIADCIKVGVSQDDHGVQPAKDCIDDVGEADAEQSNQRLMDYLTTGSAIIQRMHFNS